MLHQHWKFIALLATTTLLVAIGILNLLITPPESIALELGLLSIGVVYLATGLFVLIKQTRAAPNYHFFAWSLASFVFYFYISSGESSQLSRLASFLDGASLALLAPLFLHFCSRFLPRSRLGKSKGLAAAVYVPALEFVLLELLFYARPSTFGASMVQVRGWLDWAERLQYALFLILGITLLVRSFLRESRPDLRQQRRLIVWGLSVSALSFAAFYIIRGASAREVSPLLEAITYSPLVLIPLSFGYSMTGQRLMDVDLIVRRSFVSGAAAFAVIAAYTLLLSSLGAIIARNAAELASWEGQAAMILGMLAMAVLFPPLKNRFQMWADRWYYGERRGLRTVLPDAELDRRQLDVLIRGLRDQMVEESARRDEEIGKLTRQLEERTAEIAHITAQVATEQGPPQESASGEHLNESIVENASIGILMIDEHARITRWNRAIGELFSTRPAQALGQSIYEVINGGLVQSIEAAVAQPIWRISGARYIHKHQIAMKGVPPKIVDISLAPIENGSGRSTVMMIQNITDFGYLEQELWKGNGLRDIDSPYAGAGHCAGEPALVPDQQSSTAPKNEEPSFFQKYSPRRGF